ncbi:MAG: hypothetical protein IPI17_00430 [Nitrosomonas sp.]|jgi:hypothetical protein|nr:hypothetical protein [Nitrosomonas sp.]
MHKLRPPETIQKLLISTTSRLLGEFESDLLLVAHAWRDFHDHRFGMTLTEGPLSRSAYIVAFETEPHRREVGSILPNYAWVGDVICIYLSILYGKRFDSHGLIEGTGMFQVPDYSLFQSLVQSRLPQNSHDPRCDIPIRLNLAEIAKIEPLLHPGQDERFITFLQTAGRFYLQALQNFEERPDVAYLNLITAGEVLSNYYRYDKDELLDEQAKNILHQIALASDNGPELAKQIKGRLFQVKRRFLRMIEDLLTDQFFAESEAKQDYLRLKKEDIQSRLSAAYDLRSQHVHSGLPFGKWVSRMLNGEVCEVQIGRPVVGDRAFENVLAKAPTYFGLERIIRYCLLRFIHTHGVLIDSRLAHEAAQDH